MSATMLTRDVIPVQTIEILAFTSLAIIVAGVLYKLSQWKRVMPKGFTREVVDRLGYGGATSTVVRELISKVAANNDLFNERWRRAVHLSMFWGFVGLMVTTTWAYIVNPHGDYRPITEPYRILGNISGLILLFSSSIALLRILFSSRFRHARTWRDLTFLLSLWITTFTGFTTQYYRELSYWNVGQSAGQLLTINYWLHIIFIGVLLVLAPFTSFMHAITTPLLRIYEALGRKAEPAIGTRRAKTTADVLFIQRIYEEQEILKGLASSRDVEVKTSKHTQQADSPESKDIQFFEQIYKEKS